MPLKQIIKQQRDWADQRELKLKGHVCQSIEHNLFMPLSPAARAEFAAADGDELGMGGQTPKISSLRSSSALACNLFDPWRGHDLSPLREIVGMSQTPIELHLEQRMPHGVRGKPPNIDVVVFARSGPPVGIECKFCEPYDTRKDCYPQLSAKYDSKWEALGLVQCQGLASSIGRTAQFRRLNAGQLLKHILGLAHVFGTGQAVSLRYIWHDTGCGDADEHRAELKQFEPQLAGEIDFVSMTVAELVEGLRQLPEPTSGYHAYLASRYLAA